MIDLSYLDEAWHDAEPVLDVSEPLPDGVYRVGVHRAELKKSSNGNDMLRWTFKVLDGEHRGRLAWMNSMFLAVSLPFLKADLAKFGVTPARLSDLPDHLDSLLDRVCEIRLQEDGKYTKVFINRVEPRKVVEKSLGITDDDVPF